MRLLLLAGTVGMAAWIAPVLFAAYRTSILGIIWSVVLLVVAALLGLITAATFGGMVVLGPFYDWWAWKNGAPFQIGDSVMILAGPHCGRVTRVYEVWPTRGQLRVELSESERRAVEDVFSEIAVRRQPAVE